MLDCSRRPFCLRFGVLATRSLSGKKLEVVKSVSLVDMGPAERAFVFWESESDVRIPTGSRSDKKISSFGSERRYREIDLGVRKEDGEAGTLGRSTEGEGVIRISRIVC